MVDQFLNAYYYQQVRRGAQASRHEELHEKNKADPDRAVRDVIQWWKTESDYHHELAMLADRAPRIREAFARDRLRHLSEEEWVNAASSIYALGDHATREPSVELGLAADDHDQTRKVRAFCRRLLRERSQGGKTMIDTLHYLLWGPGDTIERLWKSFRDPEWRIPHVGAGTLGETLGWARPDDYPPRNGRTNKALYALGIEVRL